MPSVKASSSVNLKGWTQVQNQPSGGQEQATPAPHESNLARSPFMHASMPLMATTADAFVRQFYSPSNLPQQRILPAKKGSGS